MENHKTRVDLAHEYLVNFMKTTGVHLEKLPSIGDLCNSLDMSPMIVRQALERLRQSGVQ